MNCSFKRYSNKKRKIHYFYIKNNKMILSIVICTYNRKSLLELCLNSITEQTTIYNNKKIEIIIIDNNSNDGTKQFIKQYKKYTY